MKVLFLVPLWLCLAIAPASAATSYPAPAVEFAGQRYTPLTDWAIANRFSLHWTQREQAVVVTNRFHQLAFEKDSKTCSVDGLNVLLSYPVAVNNGAAFIAASDARLTLAPLLAPPPPTAGSKVQTIVIDPGHGGKDPGFQVGSNQEKKYTLLLALEVRDQLKKAGFKVSLTRTSDVFVDKSDRPDIARRRGADLFISLHWNAVTAGRESVKGVQTYCLTPPGAPSSNESSDVSDTSPQPGNRNNDKNLFLAYEMQKSLMQNLGTDDRGVRRARFTVLCLAQMPAILIEGGYMSHPTESRRIYDPAYRWQMARAIVQGVLAYKKQVELPAPARAASPSTRSSGSGHGSGTR